SSARVSRQPRTDAGPSSYPPALKSAPVTLRFRSFAAAFQAASTCADLPGFGLAPPRRPGNRSRTAFAPTWDERLSWRVSALLAELSVPVGGQGNGACP